MAKKKSERIGTLKKLAQWREQDAAGLVSEQRTKLQVEQNQLQNLKEYYQGYINTIDEQRKLDPIALMNYRSFCYQLSQTIEQGNDRVREAKNSLEKHKDEWLLRRNKRQVLEELISRCEKEESLWLQGELEKELEDITQSQYSRLK